MPRASTATRNSKFRLSRRGAAAVELAAVLPILMLMLVGVADFARFYSTATTIANAARAGAQYGAQSVTTSNDAAMIRQAALQDGVDAGSMTITSTSLIECHAGTPVDGVCPGYGVPPVYVIVTATKTVSTLIPYPGISRDYTVARTARFRVQ